MGDIRTGDGGVEFEALNRGDLDPVHVVAQALDNQWVPRDLLI
jgi:hypothetical protein